MQTTPGSSELFDTDRYPIHQADSSAYRACMNIARGGLDEVNCAKLKNFIRPAVLESMQAEAAALAPAATYTRKNLNPYFSDPDEGLPEDHPLRRFSPRVHGMVRGDRFGEGSLIRAVFENADLCRFVADCLGYEKLYTYRDPYGCVNINVQPPGCEFSWHFDHNEYTISMGLKQSREGGCFEYVPDIRSTDDENYDEVKKVLDGDPSRLRSLYLNPGDLQLFKGGYTLHRVTAPVGEERHSLILSYVTDPGHVATREYAERLWGESHPMHRT